METLVVKVKSDKAAQALADFLQTIDYVENVAGASSETSAVYSTLQQGDFSAGEKPSDFAGIWKNKKKSDAKKLRRQAWQRKK